MDDEPQPPARTTDWSRINAMVERQTPPHVGQLQNPNYRGPIVAQDSAIEVPELIAPEGILTQFKSNKIKRKAALDALQTHYDHQLDVLAHTLSKAGQVEKSRADVTASQFLKELDSKHLEVLAKLGMRNKDTRERAMLDLTDQTSAKLREVDAKDWPQHFKDEVLQELMALRKRYIAEMLAELGSEYSSD